MIPSVGTVTSGTVDDVIGTEIDFVDEIGAVVVVLIVFPVERSVVIFSVETVDSVIDFVVISSEVSVTSFVVVNEPSVTVVSVEIVDPDSVTVEEVETTGIDFVVEYGPSVEECFVLEGELGSTVVDVNTGCFVVTPMIGVVVVDGILVVVVVDVATVSSSFGIDVVIGGGGVVVFEESVGIGTDVVVSVMTVVPSE